MSLEIERKFLVNKKLWCKVQPDKIILIRQAYLISEPNVVVRVRTADDKGYVTLKGNTKGIKRDEFEYEIPLTKAIQLINKFPDKLIEKQRNYVLHDSKTWEVDVFNGRNEGLIIAEIELKSSDEKFNHPEWLDKEVSYDNRYFNSYLADKPYLTWSK